MEKVSKKKPRRSIRKRTWLLLVLLAALITGSAIYFLRSSPLPEPTRQEDPILLSRGSEEIQALGITTPEGESYPLVRGSDGAFYLLGQESMQLRSDVVDEMLSYAAAMTADSAVLDTAVEAVQLADFGLSPLRARIVVTYQDGEKKELRIGNPLPQEEGLTYCMLGGDSQLYTVLTSQIEPFFREAAYLRAFDQPDLRSDLLDRIDIAGDVTIGMYYTQTGWQMDNPYSYPLSTAQTDSLLSSIDEMAFEACLGEAEKLNLATYGLDIPALTITLTQAPTIVSGQTESGEEVSLSIPETRYTLYLGNETDQSGVYLLWDGMVYKASNFLLGFWKELTVDQLLLRQPVNFLVNNLSRVEVSSSDSHVFYDVQMVEAVTENNQIATDEYGETLYDVAVRKNGNTEDMDAEAFLSWYQQLAGIGMAGKLPDGFVPSGEPLLTLTLRNTEITRQIALYPYDALHHALVIDGVGIFYVETSFLETAQAAP